MAIVHLEGFEGGTILPDGVVTMSSGTGVPNTPAGRTTGGLCAQGSSATWTTWHFIAPGSDEIFFHVGAQTQMASVFGVTGVGACLFSVVADANSVEHLAVTFDGTGHMQLRRGGSTSTVIATSTQALSASQQWRSYEVNLVIHDTTGKCEVRVDGDTWINFSGDTRNGGTSTRPDTLRFACGNPGILCDDIFVLDTTGGVDNTWPGEICIVGLLPAANGATSGLVGSDGNSVNNFQQVDERPAASADYNGSATSLAKDTYDMTALGKVGTVIAVKHTVNAAKNDSGAKSFKAVMRGILGGEVKGTSKALSTSYIPYSEPITKTDGDGNAWTVARVDGSEFGFEVQ